MKVYCVLQINIESDNGNVVAVGLTPDLARKGAQAWAGEMPIQWAEDEMTGWAKQKQGVETLHYQYELYERELIVE